MEPAGCFKAAFGMLCTGVVIIILTVSLFAGCSKSKSPEEIIEGASYGLEGAGPDAAGKIVLKEEFISNNEYRIICRGFAKEGLTNPAQIDATAREAALLNAQTIAAGLFPGVDPVKNGIAEKYEKQEDGMIVYYTITYPNLKSKKKK